MAASTTPMSIPIAAQDGIVQYLNSALSLYETSYNIRDQLLQRDAAYYRTADLTDTQWRAKLRNMTGDAKAIQNIQVPVVMPQVESALAYHTGVFLTSYPIFGVVAPPDQQDAMVQMETLIGENSIRAGWPLELMKSLRNGLKYNLGAVEVIWKKQKIWQITTPSLKDITQGEPQENYYQGNFITNLDPYNLLLDVRVDPSVNHIQGEFAGYSEMVSRIEIKKRMADLDPMGSMNYKKALESACPAPTDQTSPTAGYYIPQVNPDALLPVASRQDFNWLNWVNNNNNVDAGGIQYKNSYEYATLYARILPSDFGIPGPNKNQVQIWKFIIVNRAVCIYAERQTNAHNWLPIIVCQPTNDGLGWQAKSFGENVIPIQQISSALVNSALESQRRKVYDRLLYDPSRVRKQDIDNVSSVARIPVKSSALGKPLNEAVQAIPYRDEGVGEIMGLSQQITQMGDILNGQNRVQQGQFQKGNKTRREFDTVMQNSNSRQQMAAISLEYSFFMPIKEIIKTNILQYQNPIKVMNSTNKQVVEIDPTVLRKAMLSFKISDGLLPSEKLTESQLFLQIMQLAGTMPQLMIQYDIFGMILYYFKLQGAHWLGDFQRDQAGQQAALQQMAAAHQASGAAGPQNPQEAAPPQNSQTGALQ